jgi:hypothetical protein
VFKKRAQPTPQRRMRPTPVDKSSSKVFSYNSFRRNSIEDVTNESMSAQKKRGEKTTKNRVNVRIKQALVLAGFVGMFSLFLINGRISTDELHIVVEGAPEQRMLLQDNEIYAQAAASAIDKSTEARFKVTFNQKNFEKQMLQQFPELSSAHASLAIFGGGVSVRVDPSSAVLLFTTKNNKSFVVDDNGRAISTDVSSASRGLIAISDQSGIDPKVGQQVLPRGEVEAVQTVVYQLKQHNITIESLTLPSVAQRLEARVQGSPYYIKFSLHENIEQQVGAYIATANRLQRDGTVPVEYVDVRVADRVYYK